MGFFSEIASEARRSMTAPARQAAAPDAAPEPAPAPPIAAPEAPPEQPASPAPTEASTPPQAPPPTEPAPSAHVPPPPEVKLSAGDAAQAPDDTAARQAHEAAEAKRKAEFDAKQAEKRAKRQAALDRIAAMNSAELLEAATGRVAADTEKLTRRNMKEAVAEHIQAKCREDAAFAILVLDQAKSMANCFRYISRKAYEYVQDELKANGIKPGPGSEGYGCDVPDDLVYEWAERYWNDPDAEEDRKDDEKFIPKPYVSAAPAPRKKAQGKADKKPSKQKGEADAGQIAFGGFAPVEEKAG